MHVMRPSVPGDTLLHAEHTVITCALLVSHMITLHSSVRIAVYNYILVPCSDRVPVLSRRYHYYEMFIDLPVMLGFKFQLDLNGGDLN
jgi:hypothetical protein